MKFTENPIMKHNFFKAENVAKQWKITREQQDQFALSSQNKAAQGQKENIFQSEIVPVSITTRKGVYPSVLYLIFHSRTPDNFQTYQFQVQL
jgi:acetyl-CoA acetyltransferase